jgi:hypothetical protein
MGEDNINLMPEGKRSKEKEIVAKQKKNWEHELVIPGQVDKIKKSKKSGSKVSIWTKLFKSKKSSKPAKDKSKITQEKKSVEAVKTLTPVDEVESIFSKHNSHPDKPKKQKHKKNKHKKHKDAKLDKVETNISSLVPKDKVESSFSVKPKEEELKFDLPKIKDHKFETHNQVKEKKKKHKKKKKQKPVTPLATSPDKGSEDPSLADWHQPVKSSTIRAKFVEDGGVDLIPTAVKIKSWPQIRNLLIIAFTLSVIIVIFFYVGLMVEERKTVNKKQIAIQSISKLEEEILGFQSKNQEIKDLADDIKTIHTILNQHIYWSNFFELLEKYTAQEVYYDGLTAGNNGALILHAYGPNFDAVARQLKALQSTEATEFVTDVSVTSATLSSDTEAGGVVFDIGLVLNPRLFYYENN